MARKCATSRGAPRCSRGPDCSISVQDFLSNQDGYCRNPTHPPFFSRIERSNRRRTYLPQYHKLRFALFGYVAGNPVRNQISNGASRALFTPLNLSEAKLFNWGRRRRWRSSIHPVRNLISNGASRAPPNPADFPNRQSDCRKVANTGGLTLQHNLTQSDSLFSSCG